MRDTSEPALLLVFYAGVVASLGPCTLIRLPVVLAYAAGSGHAKKRAILLILLFVLGLVLSYVLVGILAATRGGLVSPLIHTNKFLFWSLGMLLLAAGVLCSGLVSHRWLPERWRRLTDALDRVGSPGVILLGVLFGLIMMPACPGCGAGLFAVAGSVAARHVPALGLPLFLSFALGQVLPVLAAGLLVALIRQRALKRLRNHMCSIEQRLQLLAGNVLIVLGIYLIVVG